MTFIRTPIKDYDCFLHEFFRFRHRIWIRIARIEQVIGDLSYDFVNPLPFSGSNFSREAVCRRSDQILDFFTGISAVKRSNEISLGTVRIPEAALCRSRNLIVC